MSRSDVLADYVLSLAGSPSDAGAVLAEALVALALRGHEPPVYAAGAWVWLDGEREVAVRSQLGPLDIVGSVRSEPGPTGWFGLRRARVWRANVRYGARRVQLDGTFATAAEAAAVVDAWLRGETSPADAQRWLLVPGGLPEQEEAP